MNNVVVIDYGMGNLDSVVRAVEECGGQAHATNIAANIEKANRIILPGVGAFPEAIHNLRIRSLDKILYEQVFEKKIPFLGICLGMQLLASQSDEIEETHGLRWIPGVIKKIETFGEDTRIPHIGWNEVQIVRESPLLKNIETNKDFYFVHSYALIPNNNEDIIAYTPYGKGFVSVVQRENVFGVQFHPEKSQRIGFQVLRNFLSL